MKPFQSKRLLFQVENREMQDKVFFDTNLWVYLFLASSKNEDITKRNKAIAQN
jgi:predicted nucleic acid-binding protein